LEKNPLKFKLREPFNAISHLAGAAAAVIGLAVLLHYRQTGPAWTISMIIYGVSLCLMFLASGVYHMVDAAPGVTRVLRKLDHSAIYLLIAGTYTPFCLNAFTGFWKWGLLAVIWALAVGGIGVKIFYINAPRWITAGVYVVMGWLSVFAVHEMLAVLPLSSMLWLFTGGVIYTLGAVVYITKRMNFIPGHFGFHEIWHLFVLGGAAAHFVAILSMASGPAIL
jgi:hemolysin III